MTKTKETLDEPVLPDNYPVHCGWVYVCGGWKSHSLSYFWRCQTPESKFEGTRNQAM